MTYLLWFLAGVISFPVLFTVLGFIFPDKPLLDEHDQWL